MMVNLVPMDNLAPPDLKETQEHLETLELLV